MATIIKTVNKEEALEILEKAISQYGMCYHADEEDYKTAEGSFITMTIQSEKRKEQKFVNPNDRSYNFSKMWEVRIHSNYYGEGTLNELTEIDE